jgi:selenocysteine lyase/cysteine desulfurase
VPITRSRAYLFTGALAPAAIPVSAAWDAWSGAWREDPNSVYTPESLVGSSDGVRASFASLIAADPNCVALTDNTSRASNIAIRVLARRRGGNVVVDSGTYPSSLYPWYARGGYEMRLVKTDGVEDAAGALAERVDDDTVAICVTHVAPFTGRRHDLAAIGALAHEHGAAFMVDAAQSAGVVPIDVEREGVDVLVTTAMKWLMGPPGVGFLYLAPSVLAEAPVLDVGYLGLEVRLGDWPLDAMPDVSRDARRYELGLPNLPGIFAAKAGIDLLLEVGVDKIFVRVEELTTRLLDGLGQQDAEVITPRDPTQRAGVVSLCHPRPEQLFEVCREGAVDIGLIGDVGVGDVRVDPHAFNDEGDIDRFLDCYRRVSQPDRAAAG